MDLRIVLVLPVAVIVLLFWLLIQRPLRRRQRLMAAPFPEAWAALLRMNMPLYLRLPEELRQQLHGIIRVLLAEKRFEGCRGLEMTDEIRVTIAGQAALLLLNRPTQYFRRLKTIYVYPCSYVVKHEEFDGIIVTEGEEVRMGESWQSGPVVLAWDDVRRGVRDFREGGNVVLHEFAHQLDQEDGEADGIPILESESEYRRWEQVLDEELDKLKGGARPPFAVRDQGPGGILCLGDEAFFERSEQMHHYHRALYDMLKEYYRVDPKEWIEP